MDAPLQRLWVVGIYGLLTAWKLYDWVRLVEDDTESMWQFLKWVFIDVAFLFGLPELRIPWLELSQPFVVAACFIHAIIDFMLMFNIGIPLQGWLLGMLKVFYDREIAISEHSVKRSHIIQNSSLIMGRQIINILPEGSAILNVEQKPFCIGKDSKSALLPIYFNATIPKEVEIIRKDLDTNEEEVLRLTRSQLREIERQSKRNGHEASSVVPFEYAVKKPGAYRLGKVLDEYKLEVQRRSGYTFVVPCPEARFRRADSSTRCLGDLSDLTLQVSGTPPLQIHYSRMINGKDHSFHFQSLQPDGFTSPLVSGSQVLVNEHDVTWARSQPVTVGLNESMHHGGDWEYSVDEVHDAFGNVVKFLSPQDDPDLKPKAKHLTQQFFVRERPRVKLQGCDLRRPLKVAKGRSKALPVRFELPGATGGDKAHDLVWHFSPADTLTKDGDHGDAVTVGTYHAKDERDMPKISAPGLYTLKRVSSGSCEGEVQEPSSCLLENPLEPKLLMRSEDIPDICAGNSVGLKVDMDFTGTPPFVVRYDVVSNGYTRHEKVEVSAMRYQMELTPLVSGRHRYIFKQIDDAVYKSQPLTGDEFVLEQDVKPAASARIATGTNKISACLEEQVEIDVAFNGEAPFTLEWEIIHEGKRKSHRVTDIGSFSYKIKTDPLVRGGEYTIALVRVQDRRKCPGFVSDEIKLSVRRQRPRVSFGLLENKRSAKVIEGAKVPLPLRLTGEAPWRVFYHNVDEPSKILEKTLQHENDHLDIADKGVFMLDDIYDAQCHGVVDPTAKEFAIDWFARPELSLVQSESISEQGNKFVKNDVCEGDIDGFEIGLKGESACFASLCKSYRRLTYFTGSPPYHVDYEVRHKPAHGSSSMSRKAFDAAQSKASIHMETSKAGMYTYKFLALADNLYDKDERRQPLVLEQRVNAKPSASFVKPGQTHKLCMSDADNSDKIPMTLTGVPPFNVEIEIKHHQSSAAETYRIPSIDSNTYNIQIPRQYLKLGTQHVRIRKVRDANGCEQQLDHNSPAVQVQLFDAPAVYPLEARQDFCVGERISYTLSGTPPFEVWYTFNGDERKAKQSTTNFRRLAETAGEFVVTGVSDRASDCRASVNLVKNIHPLPAARISRGHVVKTDIHEGGEVEIVFEFWGTPPFEFTWTRSSNAKKGQKSVVLETRHDVSYDNEMTVRANQEGTYEVVAIKDKYCSFSTMQEGPKEGQKLVGY
jgi:nucleoporin POM152